MSLEQFKAVEALRSKLSSVDSQLVSQIEAHRADVAKREVAGARDFLTKEGFQVTATDTELSGTFDTCRVTLKADVQAFIGVFLKFAFTDSRTSPKEWSVVAQQDASRLGPPPFPNQNDPTSLNAQIAYREQQLAEGNLPVTKFQAGIHFAVAPYGGRGQAEPTRKTFASLAEVVADLLNTP